NMCICCYDDRIAATCFIAGERSRRIALCIGKMKSASQGDITFQCGTENHRSTGSSGRLSG
ncbi:MAG: hypothetical protein ACI87E_003963, partial [Mariniblastus sp.]